MSETELAAAASATWKVFATGWLRPRDGIIRAARAAAHARFIRMASTTPLL